MTLRVLIEKAEHEGKWLRCFYQNLWFSPAELRHANDNGRFNWSPENFELRDPQDLLEQKRYALNVAQADLEAAERRVRNAT